MNRGELSDYELYENARDERNALEDRVESLERELEERCAERDRYMDLLDVEVRGAIDECLAHERLPVGCGVALRRLDHLISEAHVTNGTVVPPEVE